MHKGIIIAGAIALTSVGASGCAQTNASERTTTPVERGRYLVQSIGCGDCHTPKKMGPNGPEPDVSRLLSGHPESEKLPAPPPSKGPWIASVAGDMTAWAGPWGVSYTANLTPDQNTGIGIWTEQMFIDALRKGKHMGVSRPILPPMPWQSFRNLSDEDLKGIFAYLKSLPPVRNHVPDPLPPAAPPAH
jgi:cytochrome c553